MTAIVLTPAQRSALRGLAHGLPVTVHIGQGGITPAVLKEVDGALTSHGLLKVRVLVAERDERDAMLQQLAEGLFCAPVQHIGRVLVLWRARVDDAVEAQTSRVGGPAARPRAGSGGKAGGAGSGAPKAGAARSGGARSGGIRAGAARAPAVRPAGGRTDDLRTPGGRASSARAVAGRPPVGGSARRPASERPGGDRPATGRSAPGAGRRPGAGERRRGQDQDPVQTPERNRNTRGPRPPDREGYIAERAAPAERSPRHIRDDAPGRPARGDAPGRRPRTDAPARTPRGEAPARRPRTEGAPRSRGEAPPRAAPARSAISLRSARGGATPRPSGGRPRPAGGGGGAGGPRGPRKPGRG